MGLSPTSSTSRKVVNDRKLKNKEILKLGQHVPRLAFLPCKERVEGSIPFCSTINLIPINIGKLDWVSNIPVRVGHVNH